MAGEPARALDPEFPNLAPDVVAGYRSAPATMTAEILGGQLSLLPRPRPRHSRASGRLLGAVDGPFDRGRDGPGGWFFLIEPELHLGARPDVLVPDLAGWRRERLGDDFLDDDATHLDVAPDWVCEVLSPSTEKVDRGRKLAIYHREGVGHAWLVSPALRTLEVYRRADVGWLLLEVFEGDASMRAEPFDAVPLDLGALWAF